MVYTLPSGSPAPANASETAHRRSGPRHLYASRISVAGRWRLSAMISAVSPSKARAASSTPGLRHGPSRTTSDMALHRCVTWRSPACIAARDVGVVRHGVAGRGHDAGRVQRLDQSRARPAAPAPA